MKLTEPRCTYFEFGTRPGIGHRHRWGGFVGPETKGLACCKCLVQNEGMKDGYAQAEEQRLISLLESAAEITYDSNPGLWDKVLTALNLKLVYQPTIAEVLREGTWRKAANARGYVATAAVRSARGKNLPDYFEKEFRRVASNDPKGDGGTTTDSATGLNLEEWGGGGVYERTAAGSIRYVDSYDDDYYREIPQWLQRGDEFDTVDWETVAAYAVLKPRMACHLARVLIMRLELCLGRPEAMSRSANADEAAAIEATWNGSTATPRIE